MFLLDTCVLSELRKPHPHDKVTAWLQRNRKTVMCLSVVTIGEIEAGIAKQRKADPVFADHLGRWLDGLIDHYGERILPIHLEIARLWGTMNPQAGNATDKLIAATALAHELKLVTRNRRHFEDLGVAIVNPFGD